jgi:hypothetical protein
MSAPSSLITMAHPEAWYNAQIWSHIIYAAFFTHPSIVISPGETACRASSRLLNSDRVQTDGPDNRQKAGPKMDGIIRSVHFDYFEFGAVESGKSFDGTTATK